MRAELFSLMKGWGGHMVDSSEVYIKHFPRSFLVCLDVTKQPDCWRSGRLVSVLKISRLWAWMFLWQCFLVWLSNVHCWSLFEMGSISKTLLFQALGCDLKSPQIVTSSWLVCPEYYSNQRCLKKSFSRLNTDGCNSWWRESWVERVLSCTAMRFHSALP